MSFDLKLHAYRLLMDEPFFAALSRKIEKRACSSIPTAGVRVDPDSAQFEMIYNPEFFASLPEEHVRGVLKHEFYHLIFDHVTSRRPDGINPKVWNICADLAINSHIADELPEMACVPGRGPFEELPLHKSAEWYLANFPERPEDDGEGEGEGVGVGEGSGSGSSDEEGAGGGGGDGNFDDHSGWDESGSTANEIAKERMKEAVKQAAHEAASGRGFGSAGSEAKKLIMDAIKTKIDWRKVLRFFCKATVLADRRSTVKKLNKRFPYIHAGKKTRRESKIAVCIDQSGSVSDAMLVAFYSELNKLCDIVEFDIIPFDSRVGEKHIYTWKKGQKREWKRVMHGGTCFDAPTKFVNESRGKYDGMIVLTDMMAPKPKRCRVKRIWMTTENYAARPYFNPAPEKMVVVD